MPASLNGMASVTNSVYATNVCHWVKNNCTLTFYTASKVVWFNLGRGYKMYKYNRKYIEQQIIGPYLVLNTVTFLVITILMMMISQNASHISDNIHQKSNSSQLESENTHLLFVKDDPYDFNNGQFSIGIFEYSDQLVAKPSEKKLSPYQKKAMPFHPIIYQVAKRYEVEPAIIKAIIMAESSFNPKAVSHKGAQGLMQLMPQTAEYMGVKDSFNPEHNIDGGVKYFKILLDRFNGNVQFALAAYNAGSRNVRKYNGVPPFKATKLYIKKVLKYYEEYKTT